MPPRKYITIGMVHDGHHWRPTAETSKDRQLALAVELITRTIYQVVGTIAVRLGRGIPRFPACQQADSSLIVCWLRDPSTPQ